MALSRVNTACFTDTLESSRHSKPDFNFFESSCTSHEGICLFVRSISDPCQGEQSVTSTRLEDLPNVKGMSSNNLSCGGGYTCCLPGCYNNNKKKIRIFIDSAILRAKRNSSSGRNGFTGLAERTLALVLIVSALPTSQVA